MSRENFEIIFFLFIILSYKVKSLRSFFFNEMYHLLKCVFGPDMILILFGICFVFELYDFIRKL